MNQDMYYWVHIETGKRGEALWSSLNPYFTEKQKLEKLNEWNRVAMIGTEKPTYHYWM